ncbi:MULTISPECIES: ferredoxin [Burkholderiaceae]|uniref:ferredoxin n=1 Tax=Burkholderiaceae TaxID=119060 RepID=UPI000B27965A|nr:MULTISPECIES: (4Fe-4S)-binding protein [Burkholderiaceae]BDB30421.1 (4Fe-4S)-binding protein [Cupriavidus sp. P-10]
MKITIYPEKCCGSGQCVVNAPDLFDQKDDGIVILLNADPSADQYKICTLGCWDLSGVGNRDSRGSLMIPLTGC